jgi:Family of unknown function (DUF6521)
MISMELYSPEEQNLYNPAYIGVILYQAIREHQRHNEAGLHCALAYLIVPLALSSRYSSNLPTSITTPISGWVADQEGELIGYSDSVNAYINIVNNAISFLMSRGVVVLSENGRYRIQNDQMSQLPTFVKHNVVFRKSFQSAGFLGRWFSRASSVESVFAYFGIKP